MEGACSEVYAPKTELGLEAGCGGETKEQETKFRSSQAK